MLITLPLMALVLLLLLCRARDPLWRSALLSAAVVWGVLLTAITEALSLLHLLTTAWLAGCWMLASLALGLAYWLSLRRGGLIPTVNFVRLPPFFSLLLGGIGVILATTGGIALIAPPNTWDSMTYHMPRVMHWIQNQSVAHYPTHMLRQLIRNPWSEWAILHLHLLAQGDRFANMVQWLSMVGSVLGASLIAKQLGADARGQILAAVVAATIPMGILQASSTQADYVVAFWLVCFVSFTQGMMQGTWGGHSWRPVVLAGASLGLAILTRATGYLYALPFLVWLGAAALRAEKRPVGSLVMIVLLAAAINLGPYGRNLWLFGSPMGPIPIEGDECPQCSHLNTAWTIPLLLSNVTRNVGLHLGTPFDPLNVALEELITRLHSILGISMNDPRVMFLGVRFHILPPFYHEDMDGNPLHLLLVVGSLVLLLVRRRSEASSRLFAYSAMLVAGFLLLCLVLEWTPYSSRWHLSLFILWSPVVGITLAYLRRPWLGQALAALLLVCSFPWLIFNSQRPLIVIQLNYSPRLLYGDATKRPDLLHADRASLYFVNRPVLGRSFREAVALLREQHCSQVWLLRGSNDWEYPLWPLLQEGTAEEVRIEHAAVSNASGVLENRESSVDFTACALLRVKGDGVAVRFLGSQADRPEPAAEETTLGERPGL